MAINLISLVSQFLTPQLVGNLARALGINEAVAQKLVAAAVPAILASLGTAAAAPGGAQKVSDAVSMSDPDILTKLSGAINGGNTRFLNEGGTLLSGLLGGGGLSSLTGALSQFSGAPQPAAQALLGTVTHATVGTIGQQDPSNWSDPSAILSMLNSQKGAISAALPPELSKMLGASGLLAGLGGLGAAAAGATQSAASRRFRAPQVPQVQRRVPPPAQRREALNPPQEALKPPRRGLQLLLLRLPQAASRCGRSF